MSSLSWNECTPHDGWIGHSLRPIQQADMIALVQLYQPVVGPQAISLYITLAYQLPLHQAGTTSTQTHLDLMKGLQLPLGELLSARYRLEGVGLWNTYESGETARRIFTYELVPPLTPARFFQSDVLSITLFHRVGKERFRQLHQQLTHHVSVGEGRDLTKTFQQVFGSLSPSEIASAAEVEETIGWSGGDGEHPLEEGKSPAFEQEEEDLSMVKARLQSYVESGAWTREVEEQIREIRFLYQLDDWDLIKALQNPYVTQNGQIHVNRLRSFVRSQYRMRFGRDPVVVDRQRWDRSNPPSPVPSKESASSEIPERRDEEESDEEKHLRVLAKMSPVELLTKYQKGKQIPRADLELVEDLIREYGLPSGVVNVLLEYVLYSQDYKLPRPLVEKIAGHWARSDIRTVEKAREMVRKEQNREWKKRKGKSGASNPKSGYRQAQQRTDREDRLPKSVAEALAQEENKPSVRINPETEARLREKLNKMHQNLSRRVKEKGSS
ncbi:replication initiation and membrane attachment family protein [Desmospora profundinema]|uniref:Replication initiation and membrane attachment protein n=1 Tax=Desmospora profundinema TaxID=1571184 RepID=A0ABU1IS46_9BACL|nr:DnaD domain protein [Desmospora profundinema]MDR6226570.1 replication initiation and membrane attachment protein [Desmospora profundinema]